MQENRQLIIMSPKCEIVVFVIFSVFTSQIFLAEDVSCFYEPFIEDLSHEKIVVCYVRSWAAYLLQDGIFTIDNIDPRLCTHLGYAYAGINSMNWTIRSRDSWQDLKENYGRGSYEKITALKQDYPHLKVTLSIGGWTEGSENYSVMAADPAKRKTFIASVVEFLKKYNFDGLDLFWEYPAARGGMLYDKENLVKLVMELKEAFEQHSYLLTAGLSANIQIASKAYDIPSLSKYLDLMHLMSYDYHGAWDLRASPHTPLFGKAQGDLNSVESTVNYVLEQGADPRKVILGIGLYGRTFIKTSTNDREDIGAKTESIGFQGQYSKETGFMGYNEICLELSNSSAGWTQLWDNNSKTPYAVKGGKIIFYDNERSLIEKVRFAMRKGLRGVMAYSIDTDDFRGKCPREKKSYRDLYNGINEIRNSPYYKDIVYQLPFPEARNGRKLRSTQNFGRRFADVTYMVDDGELILYLPPRETPNFPLMNTLNEAIVLANQEIMIVQQLEKEIKENKIKDRRSSAEKNLNSFIVFFFIFIIFQF